MISSVNLFDDTKSKDEISYWKHIYNHSVSQLQSSPCDVLPIGYITIFFCSYAFIFIQKYLISCRHTSGSYSNLLSYLILMFIYFIYCYHTYHCQNISTVNATQSLLLTFIRTSSFIAHKKENHKIKTMFLETLGVRDTK